MIPNELSEHPLKKSLMKWFWRVQQVAVPGTLAITSLSLALQISTKVQYPWNFIYSGFLTSLAIVFIAIMFAGYLWDRRFKMWHEQMVVTQERNPYAGTKLTAKESIQYDKIWGPLLRATGHSEEADFWDTWNAKQRSADPVLAASVQEIYNDIARRQNGNNGVV